MRLFGVLGACPSTNVDHTKASAGSETPTITASSSARAFLAVSSEAHTGSSEMVRTWWVFGSLIPHVDRTCHTDRRTVTVEAVQSMSDHWTPQISPRRMPVSIPKRRIGPRSGDAPFSASITSARACSMVGTFISGLLTLSRSTSSAGFSGVIFHFFAWLRAARMTRWCAWRLARVMPVLGEKRVVVAVEVEGGDLGDPDIAQWAGLDPRGLRAVAVDRVGGAAAGLAVVDPFIE